MDNNDFILKIVAELEQKGIKTGYDKLKKELEKDPAKIDVILNTSGTFGRTKGSIKKLAAELHNELSVEISKLQKQGQNINFDLSVGDVEEVIQNVINHTKKLEQNFDSASAKAQKFLAQFNKKSGGVLINSDEFKAVQTAINGLGNTHTIDDLNKSMNMLEVTYNNMVSSLRNSGKSLNPFINAKNEMSVMDETIKGIGLEFEKLSTKPKSVADSIKQLSVQQSKVNSYTIGTQEWADAYGKLQQMIQKVNAEISNLSKAKSANVATHILNTDDLDKQGKIYVQKISNTIEKTKSELESKLRNAGYTDIEIKGVEDAKGKIKSLTATITDVTGAFKQLNFERAKIQGNGKAQAGFVQTDDVKVIGNISSAVEKVQNNLSSLKTKWEEQGVLVGEFKTKVDQLESSLSSVGSKDELNGLKSQIQDLKNDASTLSHINEIQLSIETGGYESKVESLIAKTQQWTDQNGNARISTDALSIALGNLKAASAALSNNNTIENQKALIAAEKELDTQLKTVTNSVKLMNTELAKDSAVSSLHNKVADFMSKNGKTVKYYGTELNRIFNETAQGASLTDAQVRQLNQDFNNTVITARNAGKLGKTWFQTLREGMSSFSYWTSSTFLVMKAIQSVKNGISSVKALDTALVDLKKTTTMTASELEDFYYASNKVAKQMGVTTEEIISQAAEFSRLGYSSKEAATQMAKYSSWFKTISPGMSIEQAGDTLTSIMKAFKYDVQDVEKIMSMINTVGNNFAVSNLDISEILTRSSSAMMEANNSLADTIALGTAA